MGIVGGCGGGEAEQVLGQESPVCGGVDRGRRWGWHVSSGPPVVGGARLLSPRPARTGCLYLFRAREGLCLACSLSTLLRGMYARWMVLEEEAGKQLGAARVSKRGVQGHRMW